MTALLIAMVAYGVVAIICELILAWLERTATLRIAWPQTARLLLAPLALYILVRYELGAGKLRPPAAPQYTFTKKVTDDGTQPDRQTHQPGPRAQGADGDRPDADDRDDAGRRSEDEPPGPSAPGPDGR